MAVFPLLHAAPCSAPQHGGLLLYIHFFSKNMTWETNKMRCAGRKRSKTLKSSLRYARDLPKHGQKSDFSYNWVNEKGKRKKKRVCSSSEQLKQCLDTRGKGPPTNESLWCHKEVPQANNNSAVQCKKKKKLSRMNDVWQMWARLSWAASPLGSTGRFTQRAELRWAGAYSRRETVPALPAFHTPPINLSSRSRLGLTKQAVWSKAALQASTEGKYVYASILCAVLHAKIVTLSNTNWFHYG